VDFKEQARSMVVSWRDQGFMKVGTPQVVINDITEALRQVRNEAWGDAADIYTNEDI